MNQMTAEEARLWAAIESFEFDQSGTTLSFTARLARENGWSQPFADAVVQEYRRFLFLAATAGHPVTPSDEVDQAWHLHLTYSRSYWDDLCDGVLGRPLHHGPTRGGPAEGAKFDDWYHRTLNSYERLFGTRSPVDVWPPAAIRFGEATAYRRVNTTHHWVIPKPKLAGGRVPLTGGAAVLALTGCAAVAAPPGFLLAVGAAEVAAFALVAALLWLAVLMIGQRVAKDRPQPRARRGRSVGSGGFFFFDGGGFGGRDDSHNDSGGSGCGSSGCGGGGCGGGGCGS